LQASNSNNTNRSSSSKDNNTILIFDATAFYTGVPFLVCNNGSLNYDYYTTPRVIEEIRHIKHRLDAVNILVSMQRIKVIEPSDEYTVKAKDYARIYGEYELSDTDISIIALALMLKDKQPYMNNIIIVSDDFSIANIARAIGIDVTFITNKGIRHIIKWIRYCKICKIYYYEELRVCRVCGNELRKRKMLKR